MSLTEGIMNNQTLAVKPSGSRSKRRPAASAARTKRPHRGKRPQRTRRPAGTIKVLSVAYSVRYHVPGCQILGSEASLPSNWDLAASLDEVAAIRDYGRDGAYDQSRLPDRRRVFAEWRTPALIPVSRQCTCLKAAIAGS